MSERAYVLLKLRVNNDKRFTTFQPSDRHGKADDILSPATSDFRIDEVRRNTINYLVALLENWVDSETEWTPPAKDLRRLLEVLGEHLFEVLFSDPAVLSQLGMHVGQLGNELELLRIELVFEGKDQGWLARLPWEYLRIPKYTEIAGAGEFLVTSGAELLVNRRLSTGQAKARSLETAGKIRVLLVCSSPSGGTPDLPPVTCELVRTKIRQLSAQLDLNDDLIEVPPDDKFAEPDYLWKATKDNFEAKVNKFKPHVIHFIGHGRRLGSQGQLAFADEISGTPDWMNEEQFARIVASNLETKLVFLQACQSALPDPYVGLSGVARRVAAKRIPAVVGMQYRVESKVSSEFAAAFYTALADREPVDVAVQKGRVKVFDMDQGGDNSPASMYRFGLPVLYLRTYTSLLAEKREGSAAVERVTSEIRGPQPSGEPVKCLSCRFPSEESDIGCRRCGRRIRCWNCGRAVVSLDDKFCGGCLEPFEQAAQQRSRFGAARLSGIDLNPSGPATPPLRSPRNDRTTRTTTTPPNRP
jgi:hypothetical protein